MWCQRAMIGCVLLLGFVPPSLAAPAKKPAKTPANKKKIDQPATNKISQDDLDFFEKKIRPVLVAKCYSCHSSQSGKSEGGLVLDSRKGLMTGGTSGPAMAPGESGKSLIIEALKYESFEMPPNEKLAQDVIADFEKWIDKGAPDPRQPPKAGEKISRDLPAPTTPWSLHAIARPAVPTIKDDTWSRTDIDRFVAARRQAQNLKPVADADKHALLKRVYLDLIGLPPEPADVQAFLDDQSPKAFETVVDRLLASKHFGERWGRHWLDIARFAESNGKDRDVLFPEAWRYRNWVIDAVNADMPFDQFLTAQIAGDLLAKEHPEKRRELLIATGFLALGPKRLQARASEQNRMDVVDEQIDTTTRATLALTVSCARCHDHKFDPIATRDYYSLAGIFRSTKTFAGGGPKRANNRPSKAIELLSISTAGQAKQYKEYQSKINALTKQINKLRTQGKGKKKKLVAPKDLPKKIRPQFAKLNRELKALQANPVAPPDGCMGVNDDQKILDCNVLIRGEVRNKGDRVPRGFLGQVATSKEYPIGESESGRLQLAQWLVDVENPLTARVAVNRIWLRLLGEGLVRTPDNFGNNGEEPTHAKLLDYLARQYMENGWSRKKMIRQIVLSRVYQLACTSHAQGDQADPDNRLLWRAGRRRVDVEVLRDSMLVASGQLERTPPQRSRVAQQGHGEVGRGINNDLFKKPVPHRTVYLPILRSMMPEILTKFDFAEPSMVVGKRVVTTVPEQALYFMNSPFVLAQAQGFADRLLKLHEADDEKRIQQAFLICYSRPATKQETQRCQRSLQALRQSLAGKESAAQAERDVWTAFGQALFASAEFRYTP